MLTVNDLSIQFGPTVLFSRVDLQFTAGNCYGIIGANGAGKSTFIKILSGELEPTSGSVVLDPKRRMSVLKQNQSLYDDYTVLDTVIMGNPRLYECGREKDALYEKPDFNDEDGALVIHEEVLQLYHARKVEVVGRLVQQDHVRMAEEGLGQQHLDLDAGVGVAHEVLVQRHVHAETLENAARVALGLPAAELGKLLLQY